MPPESSKPMSASDLAELTERLAAVVSELKQAMACSEKLRAESRELTRYAHQVLRQSNLRRYELFHGASATLAELESLTRDVAGSSPDVEATRQQDAVRDRS